MKNPLLHIANRTDEKKAPAKKELNLSITLGKTKSADRKRILPLFSISERLKKAFSDETELRQGLKLVINDYKPKRRVNVDFSIFDSPLEFAFCLDGRFTTELTTADGETKEYFISKGMFALMYFPNTKGRIKLEANERITVLSLHASPDFLKSFIDSGDVGLPVNLNKVIEGSSNHLFITGNILPSMQIAANQIIECNFKEIARKIYLESKSLELITLLLTGLYENYKNSDIKLNEDEIQKIERIKTILAQNIGSPPSLFEMAEMVNISHTKLNQLFKLSLGTTVFGYLRQIRLEYSRFLLNEGKLNITEITYEAGWSNPSHFAREFTRAYGFTPKSFKENK